MHVVDIYLVGNVTISFNLGVGCKHFGDNEFLGKAEKLPNDHHKESQRNCVCGETGKFHFC